MCTWHVDPSGKFPIGSSALYRAVFSRANSWCGFRVKNWHGSLGTDYPYWNGANRCPKTTAKSDVVLARLHGKLWGHGRSNQKFSAQAPMPCAHTLILLPCLLFCEPAKQNDTALPKHLSPWHSESLVAFATPLVLQYLLGPVHISLVCMLGRLLTYMLSVSIEVHLPHRGQKSILLASFRPVWQMVDYPMPSNGMQ